MNAEREAHKNMSNWDAEAKARNDAKPGDIYLKMRFEQLLEEVKVERVTGTQIILSNTVRLKKRDGGVVGGSYGTSYRPDLPHLREQLATHQAKTEAREKLTEALNRLQGRAAEVRDVSEMTSLTAQINAILNP